MRTQALLAGLLLAGAAPASAELFRMKDGSRFDGTIVSVSGEYYGVDVAGKVLNIRKDSIASVEYAPDGDGLSTREGERVIKVAFGGALPQAAQGFDQIARPGLASEVAGIIQVDPHVGLGLRVDDAAFTVAYPQAFMSADGTLTRGGAGSLTAGFDQKAQVDVSSLVLELRYLLTPEKRISPFLVCGAGLNVYTESLQTTPRPNSGGWADDGSYETRTMSDASGGLAAELGAGVQFLLTRRYLAELSARWQYAGVDNERFGFTGAQTLTLLAGIGWRF